MSSSTQPQFQHSAMTAIIRLRVLFFVWFNDYRDAAAADVALNFSLGLSGTDAATGVFFTSFFFTICDHRSTRPIARVCVCD